MHHGPEWRGRGVGLAGASPAGRRGRSVARKRWLLLLSFGLITGAFGSSGAMAVGSVESAASRCDTAPTGSRVQDYFLRFTVPPGLMPDPQFDGHQARIQVHRVRPLYAHGRCRSVPNRAAVLIHAGVRPATSRPRR
jgi:hypothetical protein